MLDPHHSVKCVCEWCVAIKRAARKKHPDIYGPPRTDIDWSAYRTLHNTRVMTAAKQIREEKQAEKRREMREKAQREQQSKPSFIEEVTKERYRQWLASEASLQELE